MYAQYRGPITGCAGASVSTVVTMTTDQQINGKMEISTPCRSETPENIDPKIGVTVVLR